MELSKFIVNIDSLEVPENEIELIEKYWQPFIEIRDKLIKLFPFKNNVIDIGAGINPFPLATHKIDWRTEQKIDLDFDKLPFSDKFFNFAYSRHTLEDLQNPNNAFNEMIRISSRGFIETPSPLVECMTGIDVESNFNNVLTGYIHHRYIVWSSIEDNTLYFLPKYPLIQILKLDNKLTKLIKYLLINYPIYWNNYYYYDENNPPKIFMYRNNVNMDLFLDYPRLLQQGIYSSIDYTNQLFKYFDRLQPIST